MEISHKEASNILHTYTQSYTQTEGERESETERDREVSTRNKDNLMCTFWNSDSSSSSPTPSSQAGQYKTFLPGKKK